MSGVLQGAAPPCTVVSLKEDQDLVLKSAPGASCRQEHLTLGFPEKQVANAQLPARGLALTGFRVLVRLLVRGKDLYSSSVVLCFLSLSCQTPAHHFCRLVPNMHLLLQPRSGVSHRCKAETSTPGLDSPSALVLISLRKGWCLSHLECHPDQDQQIINNGKQHHDHSLDVTYPEMGSRRGL